MDWLKETDPFVLKDSITHHRIARGLTPRSRKWKDARQARRQVNVFLQYSQSTDMGINENGIPYYERDLYDKLYVAGWNRSYIDGKMPHWNGRLIEERTGRLCKSSRRYARAVNEWWIEATDQELRNAS